MKLMIRQCLRLLITLLFLAACASGSPQNEAPAPQEPATSAPETEVPAATHAAVPSPTSTIPATEGVEAPTATAGEPTLVAETPTTASEEPGGEPEVATSGRTEDGAYFLGREDAPLTIIDYSDFL